VVLVAHQMLMAQTHLLALLLHLLVAAKAVNTEQQTLDYWADQAVAGQVKQGSLAQEPLDRALLVESAHQTLAVAVVAAAEGLLLLVLLQAVREFWLVVTAAQVQPLLLLARPLPMLVAVLDVQALQAVRAEVEIVT
jgi:hypothetical protein